jgi:hypothetical protein
MTWTSKFLLGPTTIRRLIGRQCARKQRVRTISARPKYLLGTPLLGDFLEEGLSTLGYSCEEFELERV